MGKAYRLCGKFGIPMCSNGIESSEIVEVGSLSSGQLNEKVEY